jgi:hypothetical protein
MSVKVDVARLAEVLSDYPSGYLITVGDDFRAHTVAVSPVVLDGAVEVGTVGDTTRRNAGAHPAVTVLWPPSDPSGYSLIVDGTAALTDSGLRVTPSRAVLHRPAAPQSPAAAQGHLHDCLPIKD